MPADGPKRVFINEVSTRDGFQMELRWIETDEKVRFIDDLSLSGVAKIEVSSFVSWKAVPALADASDVFARIQRRAGVIYVALVPNFRGAERAAAAEVDEMNLVMSSSETHNRANMRMTCAQSLGNFRDITTGFASKTITLNGTIATAFGCPFEGAQDPARVLGFAERYLEIGMAGITLADTTGMANPRQVEDLVAAILRRFPELPLTLHFHNTRGMGLANVVAAYDAGARSFDGSLGGIGGCPFAPGATGNVCTEDFVHMFECMGVDTGTQLDALVALSRRLPAMVGHDVSGQVAKAGAVWNLHPSPLLSPAGCDTAAHP